MTNHGLKEFLHTSNMDMNRFFRKKKSYQDQLDTLLQKLRDQDTRVAECIKKEKVSIKKRHPEWNDEMVLKKAQTVCGQKPSVQIKDKPDKKNAYLSKYDSKLEECVTQKIPIFNKEHPEWEDKQVIAAAYEHCRNNEKDATRLNSKDLLQTFRFIKKEVTDNISFIDYASLLGYNVTLEDKSICYKMENVKETDTEYIVPVILAQAMVQPYPAKGMVMAKLPKDLKDTLVVDYETGKIIDKGPTFEYHPKEEIRDNENGYFVDMIYQDKRERLVGTLHVIKDKLSDNLQGYFERREAIHVSIGFMYIQGPGGVFNASKDNQWNGEAYDASQSNILITHLALLPPNRSRGRCPLPYCGVGITINDSVSLESIQVSMDSGNIITEKDSILEMDTDGDLFLKTKSKIINITDTLRTQSSEIKELKRVIRTHLVRLANELNR